MRYYQDFVFLNDGRYKLDTFQELIVPDSNSVIETYMCCWCEHKVSSNDSRAVVKHKGVTEYYHLGCMDAKKAGMKKGECLR